MIVLWTLIIVIPLLLVFCVAILVFKAGEIDKRRDRLKEELWGRRHRIPLLVEAVSRSGGQIPQKEELIDLREKVSHEAYPFEEQINMEREITALIGETFRKNRDSAELKSDALFVSMQKEFADCLDGIRIAANDYNFSIQRWMAYTRLPWFIIFKFAFKIDRSRPVEGL